MRRGGGRGRGRGGPSFSGPRPPPVLQAPPTYDPNRELPRPSEAVQAGPLQQLLLKRRRELNGSASKAAYGPDLVDGSSIQPGSIFYGCECVRSSDPLLPRGQEPAHAPQLPADALRVPLFLSAPFIPDELLVGKPPSSKKSSGKSSLLSKSLLKGRQPHINELEKSEELAKGRGQLDNEEGDDIDEDVNDVDEDSGDDDDYGQAYGDFEDGADGGEDGGDDDGPVF